jgi:DHA2 family multidrug resistance protein
LIIAVGVAFFVAGSYMQSHYTLQTTAAGITAAIMVQGIGFSCLFVPLTTMALANIERHKLADATGLNSLLRQIGGSIGLAIFATLLSRYGTIAGAAVSAHVTELRPEVATRVAMTQAGLMQRGMDAASAHTASTLSLYGTVMRQATVLSFEKLFLLAGVLFLGVLPLLLFLKQPKNDGTQTHVHVEIE